MRQEAHWAKWPNGDAGDAIDYALDHIPLDAEKREFLDDWRASGGDRTLAEDWPGYMKWLNFQRESARAASLKTDGTK